MAKKKAHPKQLRPKYRVYSPTALQNAFKYVKDSGAAVYKAAKMYGIPQQTLWDRISGKINPECVTTGRDPIFSLEEENNLFNHFKVMASYGYGYTRQESADIATQYAIQLGKRNNDRPLTLKWVDGFVKRWPEMKVLKPRSLEYARAKLTKTETVNDYFKKLQKTIVENGLLDKPHLIFNVDEKGISVEHQPPYIVAGKHPLAVTSGKGKTTTVIGCGSASGVAVPPYFVFPGKRLLPDLFVGASPGASGSVSETGWSNSHIFREYLETHFLKYVPGRKGEKILLILDGHKSHVSVDLVEWAKSHDIIIFILPAHTSHVLQPMDVSCYGPLQRIYNYECHKYMRSTAATVTRYDICALACKAYQKALSPQNIQSGFAKTGIYPLDRNAIPTECLIPSQIYLNTDKGTESDSTVEGGEVVLEEPVNVLSKLENQLKNTKSSDSKRAPRKTLSKIVSGQNISDNDVLSKMKMHEEEHKAKNSKSKQNVCVKKSLKKHKSVHTPKPGPSCVRLVDTSDTEISDSSQVEEAELCCVCKHFQPEELRKSISIEFVKWAQCDGFKNGMPCKHWTHLKYCCDTTFVRRHGRFLCPHCIGSEE